MFKGSVASPDLDEVVRALRGAAEPTRLRLLTLLSHGEFTVGELCGILDQSQPRVSRHLRVLTEAGLLDRFREQQCVYYRAPVGGRHLEWLRRLLAMADPGAAQLARDREQAARVLARRQAVATPAAPSELPAPPEELAGMLLEELGPASVGELLDVGTGSGRMLEILGPRAQHAVGVDISAPALRLARSRVHGAGLAHCEFRRGDMYGLPFDDCRFDTVTMDRVLAAAERPVEAIAEAARTLRGQGRLVLVEDFDRIEARISSAGGGDNALSRLKCWLAATGLALDRLRPCDLGDGHYLIALAHRGDALASDAATIATTPVAA